MRVLAAASCELPQWSGLQFDDFPETSAPVRGCVRFCFPLTSIQMRGFFTASGRSLMSFFGTATVNPWMQVLGALEKKVNRTSYETWLKPTRFDHSQGRVLFVRVPNPEFCHIGERYGDLISEAIDDLGMEFQDVEFITDEPQRGNGTAVRAPETRTAVPLPRCGSSVMNSTSWNSMPRSSMASLIRSPYRSPMWQNSGFGTRTNKTRPWE